MNVKQTLEKLRNPRRTLFEWAMLKIEKRQVLRNINSMKASLRAIEGLASGQAAKWRRAVATAERLMPVARWASPFAEKRLRVLSFLTRNTQDWAIDMGRLEKSLSGKAECPEGPGLNR